MARRNSLAAAAAALLFVACLGHAAAQGYGAAPGSYGGYAAAAPSGRAVARRLLASPVDPTLTHDRKPQTLTSERLPKPSAYVTPASAPGGGAWNDVWSALEVAFDRAGRALGDAWELSDRANRTLSALSPPAPVPAFGGAAAAAVAGPYGGYGGYGYAAEAAPDAGAPGVIVPRRRLLAFEEAELSGSYGGYGSYGAEAVPRRRLLAFEEAEATGSYGGYGSYGAEAAPRRRLLAFGEAEPSGSYGGYGGYGL